MPPPKSTVATRLTVRNFRSFTSSHGGLSSKELRGSNKRMGGYVSDKRTAFLWKLSLILHLAQDGPFIGAKAGNIPLGVIFEYASQETQSAFAYALATFSHLNISSNTSDEFAFSANVDIVKSADSFETSRIVCNHFSQGVNAILGFTSFNPLQTIALYGNSFEMPIVTTRLIWENDQNNYVTHIRPDLHKAMIDVAAYYGWRDVVYLFQSDEGLLTLKSIFEKLGLRTDSIRIRVMKRFSSAMDALSIIRNIEVAQRFQPKHIILNCPTALAKDIIISHVRDLRLGRRTYHYFIAGLAFDEPWDTGVFEFTEVNITGLRMVHPDRKPVKDFLTNWATLHHSPFQGIQEGDDLVNAALMYDGMLVMQEAFTSVLRENLNALQRGKHLTCNSGVDLLDSIIPFEHGKLINDQIRRVRTEGVTGHIEFDEKGSRINFAVDVLEISLENGEEKVGEWSDVRGFVPAQQLSAPWSKRKTPATKREYIVTSILEEPYLMLRKAELGQNLTGNDQFEGFCKDLADTIAKNMNIKFKIQLVKDGRYGAASPSSPGGWDGMIGELVRHEADVSISALTITAERERVVDFTKRFLSHGISIMVYKPEKATLMVFGFMSPLSTNTWYCVIGACIAVSFVLYLVSRWNSAELTRESEGMLRNRFSFPNALWFSFAALVQRGSDLTPRSFAGRIVWRVWSFFTLILISTYTANFAVVRSVNLRIKSAEDLSQQSDIQYGTLLGGSTYEFFRRSEVPAYKRMFDFMSGPNQLNVRSYAEGIELVREKKGKYVLLIESLKNDYTNQRKPCDTMRVGSDLDDKGLGIGTPLGSPLRHQINREVLRLKENGFLSGLEDKWWSRRSVCDVTSKAQQETVIAEELSLETLAEIFYILILGMVLSIPVSILEFFYNSKKEATNSKKEGNSRAAPLSSGHDNNPVTSDAVSTIFEDQDSSSNELYFTPESLF